MGCTQNFLFVGGETGGAFDTNIKVQATVDPSVTSTHCGNCVKTAAIRFYTNKNLPYEHQVDYTLKKRLQKNVQDNAV